MQMTASTKRNGRGWQNASQTVATASSIERAKLSGVKYIAEPGGSIRDNLVIECADKYDMAIAFTGMRLFHH